MSFKAILAPVSKKVIVSVISDLVTDQRVHRAAITLHESGYNVWVVGRELKNSLPLMPQPYRVIRLKLGWEKGVLFYAHYNLKLFFFLLKHKTDVLLSNDLDTLLPNFLIASFRNTKLVYDSHEYFTEVPELISRPAVQKVWTLLERLMFPRLKNVYTVNESIASIYSNQYKVNVKVVRNIPILMQPLMKSKEKLRLELGLPLDKKIFILQGSGINMHRGAEEAVEAIALVSDAILLIAGSGDVISELKSTVKQLKLEQQIIFKNKMPADELRKYSIASDVGLTLDKDTNLNYRFSLPNKLFDYIHAGIPVIASNLPEVTNIIKKYNVGMITSSDKATAISHCMNVMVNDAVKYEQWRTNTLVAAQELNWQKEKQILLNIFSQIE